MSNITNKSTQIFRAIRIIFHIISGLLQSAIYPYISKPSQKRMSKNWSTGLLSILSIKLRFSGTPPVNQSQPIMLVANHISWLDIYALMTICPSRFVAKAEIRNWPLLGWLSKNVGTLFIERTRNSDIVRINQDISHALTSGDLVAIFPEGTTSDGTTVKKFHASLLQSAVKTKASICPVAIRYHDTSGKISKAAAYVGVSLLESLKTILKQPWIEVELIFSDPIKTNEHNRQELARTSQKVITNMLSPQISLHKVPEKFSGLPNE
ncbi:MAG: 1-acyl-sn-glycerol-3-phosphate acyltransferase [Nitrosomonadaceae bacterium]|nr:1-acyl-sn-glycerol-3-phosphate acyltransferase [Nitrosomonadaceae bacterium]|tara:strand:- start:14 stop:811 length:798 start_codon:yes stop_codon:yes gene_type:complete